MTLWGLPITLIGLLPSRVGALLLLAAVGVGNALVDVGLFTLPSRLLPDDVLARVFGVLEALIAATAGLGAITAPVAIAVLDVRGALIAVGLLLPALILLSCPHLAAIDADVASRDDKIALPRRAPIPRSLSLPAIQHPIQLEPIVVEPLGTLGVPGDTGERVFIAPGKTMMTP